MGDKRNSTSSDEEESSDNQLTSLSEQNQIFQKEIEVPNFDELLKEMKFGEQQLSEVEFYFVVKPLNLESERLSISLHLQKMEFSTPISASFKLKHPSSSQHEISLRKEIELQRCPIVLPIFFELVKEDLEKKGYYYENKTLKFEYSFFRETDKDSNDSSDGDRATTFYPATSLNSTTNAVHHHVVSNSHQVVYGGVHSYSGYQPYSYQMVDDSRVRTGFIGLKNQGATCYLNSVIQALFHLPAFRRLVFSFPTTGTEDQSSSIPLNLQRLFTRMQLSEKAVSTKDLTHSFGWNEAEGFVQHDVHEFTRVLLDNIETKLKGTQLQNGVAELFRGRYNQYIRCKDVDIRSEKIEDFYDVQLVVRGAKSLEKSFEIYTEKELLTGNNQYTTEKYGKQDAEMGCEFIEFPKILTLHLCRFDFDYNTLSQVKVNDELSFPEEIQLSKYLSESSTCPADFILHAIIVHSGSVHAGHYYSFIRPTEEPKWFKFDDAIVSESTVEEAIFKNFGGSLTSSSHSGYTWTYQKSFSAYFLIYVRKDALSDIFEAVPNDFIPKHLIDFYENSKAQAEAKKAQAQLEKNQITVKVFTEQSLIDATFILKPGFGSSKFAHELKLDKNATYKDLCPKVAELLKTTPEMVRMWKCNHYNVPFMIVNYDIHSPIDTDYWSKTSIFAQIVDSIPSRTFYTIWCKFFFPDMQNPLQYIKSFFVSPSDEISSLFPRVNEFVGYPPTTPLEVYEETHSGPRHVDTSKSFLHLSLITGAVLIFAPSPSIEVLPKSTFIPPASVAKVQTETQSLFPEGLDIKSPLDNPNGSERLTLQAYMNQKGEQVETILYKYSEPDKPFCGIRFPSSFNYVQIKTFIGEIAGFKYDPAVNSMEFYSEDMQVPGKPNSMPNRLNYSLPSFILGSTNKTEIKKIFFEFIPDLSEEQLQQTSTFTVKFIRDDTVLNERIRLEKNPLYSDVIDKLAEKGIVDPTFGEFIFGEVWSKYIANVPKVTDQLKYPTCTYLIQQVPTIQPNEKYTPCFHTQIAATSDYLTSFLSPFFFKILEGEAFSETKVRLQPFIHAENEEEKANVQFAYRPFMFCPAGVQVLADDFVIWDHFDEKNQLFLIYGKNLKASTATSSSWHYKEIPLKIKH